MSTPSEDQIPLKAIHQEWLTPQEVCEELRIPPATFYQWRFKHVAPTVHRIGRHLRINRADLDAWLSERGTLMQHAQRRTAGGRHG